MLWTSDATWVNDLHSSLLVKDPWFPLVKDAS